VESGVPHPPIGPIFVGGTGRSGTHAVAALAAQSGRYAQVPAELRLHVCESGLPPFASGDRGRRWLLRGLGTHWWRHRPEWDATAVRGAHRIVPGRRYRAALARLASARPGADRHALSRRFVSSLLDPLAPSPGAWIEKSPANCAHARFLSSLFPRMRLIHVVRDGRDVACSLMRVPWAPDHFEAALAMWEWSLLAAHRGTQGVSAEQVHRVTLEDLVLRDRDRGYAELLAFLAIPDRPALRSYFDRELTPARARLGRWRSDLPRSEHAGADALYGATLQRLGRAGVWPLPGAPSIAAPVPSRAHPPSPLDPWAATTA